ncbi:MAG TPA: helix-hairpin-helix domain-containing protein, partial [Holophaga sp.]|nr:helix-hairpin-helix domain-containing protein [Holophaga sp.]
ELAMGAALPEMASSLEEMAEIPASRLFEELGALEGLDDEMAEKLAEAGYADAKSLYTVTVDQLLGVPGMSQDLAFRLIDAVHERFGE